MKNFVLVATAGLMFTGGVFAQSNQNPPTEVGQRRENQQDRIANGIQSGQLTSRETSNLEHKEANLNHQVAGDRSANGGKLTGQEKAQINGEQNRLSNQIYQDKHNAATQKFSNTEVGARRENQQDRIAQGVRSGRLNAGQTARLEGQQARTANRIGQERKANGGPLTPGERRQANRALNRSSRNIYRAKHK